MERSYTFIFDCFFLLFLAVFVVRGLELRRYKPDMSVDPENILDLYMYYGPGSTFFPDDGLASSDSPRTQVIGIILPDPICLKSIGSIDAYLNC